MQLRTLILQKQHDGIWIASLVLVCVSIFSQIGLAPLLYFMYKDDIRNPQKHSKLERLNNLSFALIVFISIINILINIFMLTINPQSFLDTHSLELLQRRN
jgi:Mn2+/Fe2+ NRAMP family transporter